MAGPEPAFDLPLELLAHRLDLGPQRKVPETETPVTGRPALPASGPEKVFVEVTSEDLRAVPFPGLAPGWYDSPFSRAEVERRLAPLALRKAA